MKLVALQLAALLCVACGGRSTVEVAPGRHGDLCAGISVPPVIYAVTTASEMFRFDPQTRTFDLAGSFAGVLGANPAGIALERTGKTAYVYTDANDVRTMDMGLQHAMKVASIAQYNAIWDGIEGMAFSADPSGLTETLYITDGVHFGAFDTTTFVPEDRATLATQLDEVVNLAGTKDGTLYAILAPVGAGPSVAEVDPTDGTLTNVGSIAVTPFPSGFVAWGDDFYFFYPTGGGTGSSVARIRPADGSVDMKYAELPGHYVTGAGAPVCAPP